MLGYGIGIILLNIGMYFVAPVTAVIIVIKQRMKNLSLLDNQKRVFLPI